MRPIHLDGHTYTADDLDALRDEVIGWRDQSMYLWPDTIEFTVTLSHLIGILHTVIEEVREDERANSEAGPSDTEHLDAPYMGKVVSPGAISTRHCDAQAHKGTGHGICNWPLDEHGNCPNAGRHV